MFTVTCCHMILGLLLGQHALFVDTLSVAPVSIDQKEGDEEVHFFCFESDNTHATDITWRDPHGNLHTPGEEGNDDKINANGGRLSVFDLLRNDSGSYECFRTSSPSESANGELFVYASPVILNPVPIQEIYFGVTSLLTCIIDRGNPPGTIYWLRVDYNQSTADEIRTIITESYNPRFRIVEDGLQIENVNSEDEGIYRCYVQNSHGVDLFDIHAAFRALPEFIDDVVELDIVRAMGQSVSLDCAAAGAPFPNFTWSVLHHHSQSAQDLPWTNSTLHIQLSDESDTGDYMCIVDNGVGTISRVFTVKLAMPPQPPLKYRNLTITLNKSVEINCSVTAVPEPEFQWSYDIITKEPLPQTSWSSVYDDVMGISTLVYTFSREDISSDCTVAVVCVATNSYGRSEQHFNLTLSDSINCPRMLATTAVPSASTPPIITVNEQGQDGQGQDGSGDSSVSEGEMEKTLGIVIGVAACSVIIVCGVLVLVIISLKHLCLWKKRKTQLSSKNPAVDESSGIYVNNNGMTSSLHHVPMPNGASSLASVREQRFRSVDSGVSISSMTSLLSRRTSHDSYSDCACVLPQTPSSANTLSPPIFQIMPPSPSDSHNASCDNPDTENEGIYHRLNHNIPQTHSISASVPRGRCFSSLPTQGGSPTSQLQSTKTKLENSLTSTGSESRDRCLTETSQQQHSRFLSSQRQCSQSLTAELNPRIVSSNTTHRCDIDTDGMHPNLAYETCKPNSTNDPPHIYETVA